LLLYLIIII